MKAIVYKGPYKVKCEEIENPRIEMPEDAILKVTSSGICGSDLHMYEGRTAAGPGVSLGHEIMGVVEECGPGVFSIKKGDRVVLPFNISCGVCFNCVRGYYNACLTANPNAPAAAYGYVGMGPYRGGQAEFVRVPWADVNCLKLPGEPNDELEDDFLLLSDVFPTGFHAAEMAHVSPGKSVAIFGAGPVGLLAAYSSLLKGAAEVYVVDHVAERLDKVKEIGAIPINMTKSDPVGQIIEMRTRNKGIKESRRPGEEKMAGVMCGIDAVGYQALDSSDPSKQLPIQVIDALTRVTNATGHIGIIGVYLPSDPGGIDKPAKFGEYYLPLGKLWEKGLTVATGQAPVKQYNMYLRDLIIDGRAKPSFIVSHHVSLDEVPMAYDKFDKRIEGYTKVIVKPAMTGVEQVRRAA
ncbi:MAG TPA: glutathione-independent formaldehyde dehydrogenase [Syntrophorhabdaceae bacterium]|nr:glutathione-independent formaldehyde dehydrogenase [Syntrophorhabdaceae bacterium]